MAKKLFGNTGGGRFSGNRSSEPERKSQDEAPKPKAKKKKSKLKILVVLLAIVLFIECAYCVAIFTDIGPIQYLRNMYISTAMSTFHHQWLAKALIPGDIVQGVIDEIEADKNAQMELVSSWNDVTDATTEATEPTVPRSPSVGFSKDQAASLLGELAEANGLSGEISDFFKLFHELDEESTRAYVDSHPEVVANGWSKFHVNEAGLDDDGTEIYTRQGDQVLAINAEHGLLLIRVTGTGYRGILCLGKDPSRLKLAPAKNLGSVGQYAGVIAENNNALLAMTASGFGGAEGVGEGGDIAGAAMFSGKTYGTHFPWGYKRIELHTDNRLYVTDAHTAFGENCTDASEFMPALIVDGDLSVSKGTLYTAVNPRACLGQTRDESIMFLVIEGRFIDSVGTNAEECAEILARYDGYQAMNVDGGSSAILWYEGEYITRCSNNHLSGRHLPNAWVYCTETVPDPE